MGRWSRGLFPAFVLIAGTSVYWGKVAQQDAARQEGMKDFKRPTIVGVPAVRVQPAPGAPKSAAVSETPPVPVADAVNGTLKKLDDLASDDQPGLDRLFAEMKAHIRANSKGYVDYFRAKMKSVESNGLKQSFFLVKALVDNVGDPTTPLKELFLMKADMKEIDPHHGFPKVNLVKSFAMEQWALSTARGPGDRELLPILQDVAKHEPDLAVARQAVQTIAHRKLVGDTSAFLQEVRKARKPDEQFAFESL